MKEIVGQTKKINAKDLLQLLSSQWATTEDIMKLAFVGESKAREMTKEITDIVSKEHKKKLPRGLFPMQVVQEYLGININYLKKIERG